MSALDDAEKLARDCLHRGGCTEFSELELAAVLLAVLPVVRSLLAELERGEDEEGNSTMVTVATLNAIDTMHAALEKS